MAALHAGNNFFETTKPWELKNGDDQAKEKLETIISLTMEVLRISGTILQPIIPEYTGKLLQRLNIPSDQRFWSSTKLYLRNVEHSLVDLESNVLFKRIILEKPKLEMEKKQKPEKQANKKRQKA